MRPAFRGRKEGNGTVNHPNRGRKRYQVFVFERGAGELPDEARFSIRGPGMEDEMRRVQFARAISLFLNGAADLFRPAGSEETER